MQEDREADWTLKEINKSAAAIEAATQVRLVPELSLYVLSKNLMLEKDKIDQEKMEKLTRRKTRRRKGRRKR